MRQSCVVTEPNERSFLTELKRRNVYKVAVAYAIVGWLVMQVAATAVPALHLSDSITSAVVLLVILGFPIALILAWVGAETPTRGCSPDTRFALIGRTF